MLSDCKILGSSGPVGDVSGRIIFTCYQIHQAEIHQVVRLLCQRDTVQTV